MLSKIEYAISKKAHVLKLKMFRNEKKLIIFYSVKFIKFIFELHFGDSKINTRVVPFSSIVGVWKLLDNIYMKKCICQNMRDVPFFEIAPRMDLWRGP